MARQIKVAFLGDASDLNRATVTATEDLDKLARHTGAVAGAIGGAVSVGITALAGFARSAVGFLGQSIKEAEQSASIAKVTAQLIQTTGGAAKVSADQVGAYATQLSNV